MSVDVVVLGGGNAALCAAISAARAGCSVLLLESAPKPYRGGIPVIHGTFAACTMARSAPPTNDYLEDEYISKTY